MPGTVVPNAPLLGAGAVTTAVGWDVAWAVPLELLPVTTIRMLLPTSALATTYEVFVAPAIFEQTPLWQDRHCQERLGGGLPDHVPDVAVSVRPTSGMPSMAGGTVLEGGTEALVTVPVDDDVATDEPPSFVAVTATRIVNPASPETSVYVDWTAPAMSTQLAPDVLHFRH